MAIATAILELRTSTADSISSMLPALPMADQLQAVDGDLDRLMATWLATTEGVCQQDTAKVSAAPAMSYTGATKDLPEVPATTAPTPSSSTSSTGSVPGPTATMLKDGITSAVAAATD